MKQFSRSDRVAEEMRRLLSQVWEEEYAESAPGMVTITHVRLSKDLRYATAYYSFLGSAEDREWNDNLLLRETKKLRHLLGRRIRLRHIPELTFKFDPSIEEGIRIERLLNEINSDKKEQE